MLPPSLPLAPQVAWLRVAAPARLGLSLKALLDPDRLVFRADSTSGSSGTAAGSAGPPSVVVKFVLGGYGAEAHTHAAAAGYAPHLLHDEPVPGGWRCLVMEYLGTTEWQQYDNSDAIQRAAAEAAYAAACSTGGFVHGDLRPSNILVSTARATAQGTVTGDDPTTFAAPPAKRPAREVQVRFLDFDWAGRAGQAHYPLLNSTVKRAPGVASGEPIKAEDDRWMLQNGQP